MHWYYYLDSPSFLSGVLRPPIEFTVSAGERGGLLVSWQPNPLNDDLRVGYKLEWDIPDRITQTAVVSIPPTTTQYLIEGVDLSLEYKVLVWAYSFEGDGMSANAMWKPRCKPPMALCFSHHMHDCWLPTLSSPFSLCDYHSIHYCQ